MPTGLSGSTWATFLLDACVVALVGFPEGWGAESTIASTTHDELDANQEFRAFGVGSIGGLKRYASRYDVEILIARLHADARQTLARDGVLAEIGKDHIYDSVQAAVAASNGSAEQQDKSAEQTEQEDKGPGR